MLFICIGCCCLQLHDCSESISQLCRCVLYTVSGSVLLTSLPDAFLGYNAYLQGMENLMLSMHCLLDQ